MNVQTILYILLILTANMGIIWGLNLLRKRYKGGLKGHITNFSMRILILIVGLVSLNIVLEMLGLRTIQALQVELFRIGDEIPVTGLLLAFLLFSVTILIITNRFLTRLFSETRGRGMHSVPRKVTKVVRRWASFVAFLILMQGVISLTDNSFSFFGIGLFNIQDVQITIGKILQAFFMAYTVHLAVMLSEFYYNQKIRRTGIDFGKGQTVFQIIKYFAWVITIVFIVSSLGISVTVLMAGSAALFVGLGFGVQSLFNDFVSGLIILFEGTIRINDVVELESGIIGKVHEIGLRTSKVLTRDNIITIIPNNNFVGKNVINWTYNEHKTRFKVEVGVAYGSDVRLVEKILIACALEHEKIYKEPKPMVQFNNFGESSLDFSLFFWIDDSFWVEMIRSDLRFAINDKFKSHQIQIPFPQRDLHIRSGHNS